jgi:GT2 family glycosyltransferase
MMIRRDVFIKVGMYNEQYRHCFEDVELNLKLKLKNLINYINGKCVAYHYESQSRDIDETSYEMNEDYNNMIFPIIKDNFDKLKKDVYITQ